MNQVNGQTQNNKVGPINFNLGDQEQNQSGDNLKLAPTPFTITENEAKDEQPLFINEKSFIELLKSFKKHTTTAPTNKPRNIYEQIEFYDDGADIRMYFYVNGSWRYVALT